jgi:hypothetical protein
MGVILKNFITFSLLLDIFIQADLGFYEKGELNLDRYEVTINYFQNNFFKDLFLFLFYTFAELIHPYFLILFLLKLEKIPDLFYQL